MNEHIICLYRAMLNHNANVVRYYDSEHRLELELDIWERRELFRIDNLDGSTCDYINGPRRPYVVTLCKDENED